MPLWGSVFAWWRWLLLLVCILNLTWTSVSSTSTCFDDGSCYDLRTYVATPEVRAQFNESCVSFAGWNNNGGWYCHTYLTYIENIFPNTKFGPDYAAMAMFINQGVFDVLNDNLTVLSGKNVPVNYKVPMLLTASGINLLAQNLTNQAFVDSIYVYSGSWTYSSRCPLNTSITNSGTFINTTWTDWTYLSTSRAGLVALLFTYNIAADTSGTLSMIKRASNLTQAQHPYGIGAYDWPVAGTAGGYTYQYEVTMPSGMVYHSFYCEQRRWCLPYKTQITYPITIEYMYLINENEAPLSKEQEAELLTEMQAELANQETMCWGFYCNCDPPATSAQEPVLNSYYDVAIFSAIGWVYDGGKTTWVSITQKGDQTCQLSIMELNTFELESGKWRYDTNQEQEALPAVGGLQTIETRLSGQLLHKIRVCFNPLLQSSTKFGMIGVANKHD